MTGSSHRAALISQLRHIVGDRHVITRNWAVRGYCRGFRSGSGQAIAAVRPGSLLEQWQVLQACVEADVIVIMQAANTGLTEGSTPKGSYEREVVIISTLRINRIQFIDDGRQIVAFSGATLFALERMLAPHGRAPHSVIGSSCAGASIIGGVCNNSGGALVARGPSYTELSLHARITASGKLELVNHLAIDLGDSPQEILTRLEAGNYSARHVEMTSKKASARDYDKRVRAIDEPTPARFNADRSQLFEAAGCAGKLAVFAVRLDTFPKPEHQQVFYIGTNDTKALTRLRQEILSSFEHLPVSGEYMHRDCYDMAEHYGKDMRVLIDVLGTGRIPPLFAFKRVIDAFAARSSVLPDGIADMVMQGLFRLWPGRLPKRMRQFRRRFAHHLILTMADDGIAEAKSYLADLFVRSHNTGAQSSDYFICTRREGHMAGLHRYVAAGAAIRYCMVHRRSVEDVLALDIALPRNCRQWFETLDTDIESKLVHKLYYGHFFCHVLHQDYIVKKKENVAAIKAALLEQLRQRGAEYPAEHNVGHLYEAKPALKDHYRKCDPTNSMNPGIGGMSRNRNYG